MGVIREEDTVLGTLYSRYDNKGELILTTGVIGFQRERNGFIYFIITDLNGKRISAANKYLNSILKNSAYKKRENAYTALKLFFSCMSLNNIHTYSKGLDQSQSNLLIGFLEGGNQLGNAWDIEFKTMRSNNTINNYLTVYRDFYKRIWNITDTALHDSKVIAYHSGGGMLGHANKKAETTFASNRRSLKRTTPPKYIKPQQYEYIICLINKKYTLREKVIIKLMYEYGLRIGEVLGLTIEDFEGSNQQGMYRLYIRNRLSDKPWQSAKSVMKIITSSYYQKREYQEEGNGFGFQKVIIDSEMMNLINEYLDETRDEFLLNASPIKRKNLEVKCVADKVTGQREIIQNQYLFLNKQHYTPLTQPGWNSVLHKIFKEINIAVDKVSKESNLSHRFRHGFAMSRVREGYSHEKLANELRHSGIGSVMIYYNPDEDDQIELKEKHKEHMNLGGIGFNEQ
ncbi:tyrosine-type recombinase/integrase [Paenibacillus alginolyticus]|uniref:Site-specific integrase n=1 Tax=Paenibacillus alginolyticus TaxID=59839 RepID=A0ABT4G7P3_9BACL|nr:site-specific integrase [Paenibacillus alginolyticus]MCY9692204.1 site-specific integrase [Paenibacillus alginolyticus]MEC0145957.1 site-specific integrase [Paenibacillus alginolyticus]